MPYRAPAQQEPRMDVIPLSDLSAWQRLGGADTAAEIAQQPALWETLADTLANDA